MKRSILMETKRMFSSIGFKLSVFLAALIVLGQFLQNLYYKINGINELSIFVKWIGTDNNSTFAEIIFVWLFPILSLLPYAWTMCEELHNGYAAQAMIRNGKKNYFAGKIAASFLSGGIVVSLVLMLDFIILTMMDSTYYPTPNDLVCGIWPGHFCSILFYKRPFVYILLWTVINFLWGASIAVLGCAVGFFVKDKIKLLPFIWLIWVMETLLSEFLPIRRNGMAVETSWLKLLYANTNGLNPAWVIFGSIGIIFLVSLVIIFWKGVRYEAL